MKSYKRKKSGQIFEISLKPFLNGYGYAKFIDISGINNNIGYPFIIRVYDFCSPSGLLEVEQLDGVGLLMNPIFISGANGIVKNWKPIGFKTPEPNDFFIPYVRKSIDILYKRIAEVDSWLVLDDKRNYFDQKAYETIDVAHLDIDGATSIDLIPFRIALELLKKQGKDIKEIHEIDFYQQEVYDRTITMPILSSIPSSKWGRL